MGYWISLKHLPREKRKRDDTAQRPRKSATKRRSFAGARTLDGWETWFVFPKGIGRTVRSSAYTLKPSRRASVVDGTRRRHGTPRRRTTRAADESRGGCRRRDVVRTGRGTANRVLGSPGERSRPLWQFRIHTSRQARRSLILSLWNTKRRQTTAGRSRNAGTSLFEWVTERLDLTY